MVAPLVALEIAGVVLSAIGIGLDVHDIVTDDYSEKAQEIPDEFPLVGPSFESAIENEIRRQEPTNNTTIPRSIARRPPIYTPPQLPPIEIPDRKLPTEADGQTDFDTPNGRSISLNTSLKNRAYGKLLWNPVSDETVEQKLYEYGDIAGKIQTLAKDGLRRFEAYLEGKNEIDTSFWEELQAGFGQFFGGSAIDKKLTAWHKTALVYPGKQSSLTGDIRLVYGLKVLSQLSWIHYLESRNALSPVIDFIPKKVKVKKLSPPAVTNYENLGTIDVGSFAKLDSVLGVDEFPKTLPKSLTADEYADDYNPEENKVEIKTFGDLMIWQALQLDALVGQFPIKIKITDTDLLEPGEQERKIYLPNLAETVKEILGLNMNQQTILEALIEINLRLLGEGAADRMTNLNNYYRIRAIADYLGYKVKQESVDVDFSFDPSWGAVKTGVPLSTLLKPSKQKIVIEDNDDDRTQETIADGMLEAARIIKAVFWHKWKGADAEKSDIKSRLEEFEKSDDDFDAWLEKIEIGFSNDALVQDPLKPYGRSYEQRPRVRNIGNKQGTNDGGA